MLVKRWTNAKPSAILTSTLAGGMLLLGLGLSTPNAAIAQTAQPVAQSNLMAIPGQVVRLRQAIIGQESGANFRAVNRHSGALGYGQIMPANLPSWSREAVGYVVSPREFLENPALQIAIIDYKLNQYWRQAMQATGGDEDLAVRRVAAHWYSGKPYRYSSTKTQYYNGHRYPSIADYTISVLNRYRQITARAVANSETSPSLF